MTGKEWFFLLAIAGSVAAPKPAPKPAPVVVQAVRKVEVLKFSATWCGPCARFAPVFEGWRQRHGSKDVTFTSVDIDQHPDVARAYGVQSVPTVVVLVNGRVAETFVGAPTEAQIVRHLK